LHRVALARFLPDARAAAAAGDGRPLVLDTTGSSFRLRAALRSVAVGAGRPVVGVWFGDVPYGELVARNMAAEHRRPPDLVRRVHLQVRRDRVPIRAERWDGWVVVGA